MKENCILLFLTAPSVKLIDTSLLNLFGEEKAVSLYTAMSRHLFHSLRKIPGTDVTVVYKGDSKHYDLRWLDNDDPGFLTLKGATPLEQLSSAIQWVHDAGARRIGVLSAHAMGIPLEPLELAFKALEEKELAAGKTPEGDCYFIGVKGYDLRTLTDYPFKNMVPYETLIEAAKKLRIQYHEMPEFAVVKDENEYRKWAETLLPQETKKAEDKTAKKNK